MSKKMKEVIDSSKKENKDVDSKKNENGKKAQTYNPKDRKAIEEFVFAVEISTEIISDIITKKILLNQAMLAEFENELKKIIERYYMQNKSTIYIDSDTVLNGLVKLDQEKINDLLTSCVEVDGIEYKETDGMDGDEFIDELFRMKHKKYMTEKYSSENIEYVTVKKNISLFQYLRDQREIEQLRLLAKKCVNQLTSVSALEYTDRLRHTLLQLSSFHDMIIKSNNGISPEIKFWRELIMEESSSLIKEIEEERLKKYSQRIRVLMLNSLIRTAGIFPDKIENKERFIAEVLDLDMKTTSTYLKDLVKNGVNAKGEKMKMGMTEANCNKQLVSAQITCELLKSKGDDETDSDRVVKALVNHVKLAGTPEYKDEK